MQGGGGLFNLSRISANPGLKFNPVFNLYISVQISGMCVYFKTSEEKILSDPNKISEETTVKFLDNFPF